MWRILREDPTLRGEDAPSASLSHWMMIELSFQWWKIKILSCDICPKLHWGHGNGPLRKALVWVPLGHRKISSLQHASLSFVSSQDYSIIHPSQEAEEDTWAGGATSKTLYRHCAVLLFTPLLGQRKFRIGRTVHVSVCTQGQSKDVRFVL